ncbi:MAG: NADPH-dependent glutamate synthase [Myxococcales bacterium]|nr:NADPH-dependent glutamate synthase [Myxococcales bacterium]
MSDRPPPPKDLKLRYKTPRQQMPRQDAAARGRNFFEVALGLAEESAKREAYRCIYCKEPDCIKGCPVTIDIPGFLHEVEKGDFRAGVRVLKRTNLLPAICGRVCPQEEQCELVCKVGKGKNGVPVAIGRVERFLADWERANGTEPPAIAATTGKKVAVVGSGPAGLTAAADLARLGHQVTIFEALHKPGGVLVYGIPEFRLPKEIVAYEIDNLRKMGVEIVCNFVVGLTRTVDELLREFDAIFLGTGAGLPYFMDLPGENLGGVYSANEYLTRVNLMGAFEPSRNDTPVVRGRNVVVVGGGNVAMDSARTAVRLGAEKVRLVYRRSLEEMPAREEEIHHAQEEGIDFTLLTNPVRYLSDEKGRVHEVECLRMELSEPGPDGRRKPLEVKGSEHRFPADTVVVAIGNGPNPLVPRSTTSIETRKGKILVRDESGRTSLKGVFAGGDIVLGAATVILAMGAGRKAAASIDEYLRTGVW